MDKSFINPLNVVFSDKRELRPAWMCKHPNATVIDYANLIFLCYVCYPGGEVRIVRSPPNPSK